MITIRLSGGLGNQMFQYAAARALALRRHTEIAVDTSYYVYAPEVYAPEVYAPEAHATEVYAPEAYAPEAYATGVSATGAHATGANTTRADTTGADTTGADTTAAVTTTRHSALAAFDCPQPVAPAGRSWLARRQRYPLLRWLGALPGVPHWYRERGFDFDARVLTQPAQTYLQGYFQSERYFGDYAAQIRKDFEFSPLTCGPNVALAAQIDASCAVAIHIRLGDYQDHPRASAVHGVLDASYYRQAVAHCQASLDAPRFFVFTDTPARVPDLELPVPLHIVTHNRGAQSFRDMQLMSRCAHQVIANSSFSWWAAWLNVAPGKRVIAPRNWFARTSGRDTRDLLPASWLQL